MPWQLYRAEFEATSTWQELRIPFNSFSPYGGSVRETFQIEDIRSLAVVAFGRDHDADLLVRAIGVY